MQQTVASQSEPFDTAGLGQECARILGIQAHLDRVPVDLATVCCKRFAVGDAELLGDEVEAGDRLRDRVLDLDAAVQLEEEEVVSLDHELDRPGAAVADRAAERDRGFGKRLAQRAVQARGAGASSSTFWWRRWIEQSRSPSEMTFPCASARS